MAAHDAGKSDLYGGIILCLANAAALAVRTRLGVAEAEASSTRQQQGRRAARGGDGEPKPERLRGDDALTATVLNTELPRQRKKPRCRSTTTERTLSCLWPRT